MSLVLSATEIRRLSHFERLSEAEAARLSPELIVRRYDSRETIVAEGEPSRGFCVLLAGKARIYRAGAEGREQTLRIIAPQDTFGEVPVFDDGPNPATVEAIERCEVLLVPTRVFLGLIDTNPAVARAMLHHFARRLRAFTDLIQQISTQTVQGRLARYLYQLAREEGVAAPDGIVVPRQITQQDLASLVGSVREVVSRTLRTMADDGIVEVRRTDIIIRDLSRLERLL